MQGKVHADAMATIYVGIDVCKAHLDVHLHPAGERFRVANDASGWRHLLRRLDRHAVALTVMEATSKYHRGGILDMHDHARLPQRLWWNRYASAMLVATCTLSRSSSIR